MIAIDPMSGVSQFRIAPRNGILYRAGLAGARASANDVDGPPPKGVPARVPSVGRP